MPNVPHLPRPSNVALSGRSRPHSLGDASSELTSLLLQSLRSAVCSHIQRKRHHGIVQQMGLSPDSADHSSKRTRAAPADLLMPRSWLSSQTFASAVSSNPRRSSVPLSSSTYPRVATGCQGPEASSQQQSSVVGPAVSQVPTSTFGDQRARQAHLTLLPWSLGHYGDAAWIPHAIGECDSSPLPRP